MTVKPFSLDDLGAFLPNKYSNPDEIFPLMLDARYVVKTMWGDDGLVQAIICFRNYWGNCWSGFILVAENFQLANALRVKELIEQYMAEHKAVRFATESIADATLRKWHEFLGFVHEGTKRKMMFDRDYDMWAIVREGA